MIGSFLRVSLLGLAVAAPVRADGALHVEYRAERLIVTATGAKRATALAPADQAQPGDEILYTVSFTNTSARALAHATVTAKIPAGMRYVAGSASGPGTDIRFSIDGGNRFAVPDELTFGDEAKRRPAAAEFYTDIRWTMRRPLAPGATAHARFRAVAAAGPMRPKPARQRAQRSPPPARP